MHIFHIRYRNTQGTLMRILGAAARRGIELPYVQAEPIEHSHKITLLMDVNAKQVGQLCRDWQAIVDVMDVRPGAGRSQVAGDRWQASQSQFAHDSPPTRDLPPAPIS